MDYDGYWGGGGGGGGPSFGDLPQMVSAGTFRWEFLSAILGPGAFITTSGVF